MNSCSLKRLNTNKPRGRKATRRWTERSSFLVAVLTGLVLMSSVLRSAAQAPAGHPWINEFDYVNEGRDTNEWVELAGPAGLPLAPYELRFYSRAGVRGPAIRFTNQQRIGSAQVNGVGFFVMGKVNPGLGAANFRHANWEKDEIPNTLTQSIQLAFFNGGATVNVHFVKFAGENTLAPPHDQVTNPSGEFDDDNNLVRSAYQTGGPGTNWNGFAWANEVDKASPGAMNFGQIIGTTRAASYVTPVKSADLAMGSAGNPNLFGDSVAIDGNRALVATPYLPDAMACLFQRQPGTKIWDHGTKLNVGHSYRGRGQRVALDGDTAVIAAEGDSVYVFTRQADGSWQQKQRITMPSPDSARSFAGAVALDGDTLMVSCLSLHELRSKPDPVYDLDPIIYVFERNFDPQAPTTPSPGAWGLHDTLTLGSGAGEHYFGLKLALEGATAVVGQAGNFLRQASSGLFRILSRGDDGKWSETFAFNGAPLGTTPGFGTSVALSGDNVLVGDPTDDGRCPADPECNSGAAYLFTRNRGGTDRWGLVTNFHPGADQEVRTFGGNVALSGDAAAIGSLGIASDENSNLGTVSLFQKDKGGPDAWGLVTKLQPETLANGRVFGYALALQDRTLMVGEPSHPLFTSDFAPGAAHVYSLPELVLNVSCLVTKPLRAGRTFTVHIDLLNTGAGDAKAVVEYPIPPEARLSGKPSGDGVYDSRTGHWVVEVPASTSKVLEMYLEVGARPFTNRAWLAWSDPPDASPYGHASSAVVTPDEHPFVDGFWLGSLNLQTYGQLRDKQEPDAQTVRKRFVRERHAKYQVNLVQEINPKQPNDNPSGVRALLDDITPTGYGHTNSALTGVENGNTGHYEAYGFVAHASYMPAIPEDVIDTEYLVGTSLGEVTNAIKRIDRPPLAVRVPMRDGSYAWILSFHADYKSGDATVTDEEIKDMRFIYEYFRDLDRKPGQPANKVIIGGDWNRKATLYSKRDSGEPYGFPDLVGSDPIAIEPNVVTSVAGGQYSSIGFYDHFVWNSNRVRIFSVQRDEAPEVNGIPYNIQWWDTVISDHLGISGFVHKDETELIQTR